jgi:hypothetical protein
MPLTPLQNVIADGVRWVQPESTATAEKVIKLTYKACFKSLRSQPGHMPLNQRVPGSSPGAPTISSNRIKKLRATSDMTWF